MLIVSVVIAFILFVILIFLGYFFVSEFFGRKKNSPYVGSFSSHLNILKQHRDLIKPGSVLIDLGCGDGKALRFLTKQFKIQKAIGYDINSFAVFWGSVINKVCGYDKIQLIHKSLEDVDLSKADVIYLYLMPQHMATIEDKVFSKIEAHTKIISNSFVFLKHYPIQTIKDKAGKERFRVYVK